MTPAELRAALLTLLSSQLGTYKNASGTSMGPAVRVGEPPSDWTASGLEIIIDPSLNFDNRGLHQHTAIVTEIPVRVIPRGADGTLAVTRITQRFNATNPTQVPANERLGILTQYTLHIRS